MFFFFEIVLCFLFENVLKHFLTPSNSGRYIESHIFRLPTYLLNLDLKINITTRAVQEVLFLPKKDMEYLKLVGGKYIFHEDWASFVF